jgi:CMP-N,N'-diacetyllegionaminic acid synthase
MTKVVGIIPARGGSKGIPGKNIRLLAGKPLIHYSVASALDSNVINRLILSTDSAEIVNSVKGLDIEIPFIRPANLAFDDTPMISVIFHAVNFLESNGWKPDIIVLLQPTAPLRKPEHIRTAVELLINSKCDSVVSVVEVPKHFSPDYVMKIDGGKLQPFLADGLQVTRRQDVRPVYSRDGTIYAVWRDILLETNSLYGKDCRPLLIPSDLSCNLDTMDDWEEAQRKILS